MSKFAFEIAFSLIYHLTGTVAGDSRSTDINDGEASMRSYLLTAAILVAPSVEAYNPRSPGCTFGLDQLLGTCPGENVVRGSGSWACGPATLFHEIALLPG